MPPRQESAGGIACRKCGTWKPLTEFHRKSANRETRRTICKTCHHQETKESTYVSRHGMTQADVALLVKDQGGCAVCGTQDPGGRGWHIDHDHSCQRCTDRRGSCSDCRRGVLCTRCNTALGLFGDSLTNLRSAISYLTGGSA